MGRWRDGWQDNRSMASRGSDRCGPQLAGTSGLGGWPMLFNWAPLDSPDAKVKWRPIEEQRKSCGTLAPLSAGRCVINYLARVYSFWSGQNRKGRAGLFFWPCVDPRDKPQTSRLSRAPFNHSPPSLSLAAARSSSWPSGAQTGKWPESPCPLAAGRQFKVEKNFKKIPQVDLGRVQASAKVGRPQLNGPMQMDNMRPSEISIHLADRAGLRNKIWRAFCYLTIFCFYCWHLAPNQQDQETPIAKTVALLLVPMPVCTLSVSPNRSGDRLIRAAEPGRFAFGTTAVWLTGRPTSPRNATIRIGRRISSV